MLNVKKSTSIVLCFQPDRIPPPAGTQPHSTVAPSPVANLIDLDTPSPQPVTNNPLAPTSANDVHLQLGGMSKFVFWI